MGLVKFPHLKEYVAAISCTLIMISAGNSIGWTSPTLPYLLSKNSTITITPDQSSWINSLMILSSTSTAIPAAYLADRFGRKNLLLLAAVPYIIGWIMIIFAKSVWEIYIARIFPGLGYGIIYTVAPMYLGEIASDNIRGSLSILITVMNKLGILLQYCIGPYVSMTTLAMTNLIIPIVYFLTFMWQPESPYYYVKKSLLPEAGKALEKLKRSKDINIEIKEICNTIAGDVNNKGKMLDLFTDNANRKALTVTLVLFATQQFCGSAAVISYAQTIFSQAEGGIEASNASIILGSVQLLIATTTVFLVDKLGRRPLLLISSFGVFIANIIIGAYFFCKDYLKYDMQIVSLLPIIVIVGYIILYTIGLSTVPMAVTSEMFPTNVKSHATSILQIFVGLSTFTVTKLFQVIADAYGIYTIFWIFGFWSLIGSVFTLCQLPETKKRSFSSIQQQLKSGVS